MLFNTLQYLIFFPAVIIVYFMISHRYRWILLLAASYYFYMCWKAEYIFLIIASTLVDYYCGLRMGSTDSRDKRRIYLIISLLVNLGLLFSFKYYNFFNDSARALFDRFNIFYGLPAFKVLLPVGISFYTFQTLSYTIEVYRQKQKPERHLGIFALYVAFFPQLVAGPIERAQNLLPQFYNKIRFDYARISSGGRLILWGLFKKIVIADRLAVFVNQVYNKPGDYEGIPLIVATVFFAFQIFCDFSGYSDIAIGSARILGVDLMKNFNRPYFAKTIPEFWKRWHISLSTWFRDYLYIPLGGNRVKRSRLLFNIVITFLLSGLWHGANWTFVVWGLLHGFFLVLSGLTSGLKKKVSIITGLEKHPGILNFLRIIVTFSLVCFAWIFFRANNLADAVYITGNLFTGIPQQIAGLLSGELKIYELLVLPQPEIAMSVCGILMLETVHFIERKKDIVKIVEDSPLIVRWLIYVAIILLIFNFGQAKEIPFIYFQF